MSTGSALTLTILGCSASAGTPLIGCTCPVCTSTDPKNNRTRCSAYIQYEDTHIIIDTGPDFRQQVLRERIPRVDAVLYTHLHADHLNGLDDLRVYCKIKAGPIPLYGEPATIRHIKRCFGYALNPPTPQWETPVLTTHNIQKKTVRCGQLKCQPIPVLHGQHSILGWRIGNLAWLTDTSTIPDTSLPLLQGLEVLCIDCFHTSPFPSHATFDQSCRWAKALAVPRTILIHMSHVFEYEVLKARCPPSIEPAYDGMKITLPYCEN